MLTVSWIYHYSSSCLQTVNGIHTLLGKLSFLVHPDELRELLHASRWKDGKVLQLQSLYQIVNTLKRQYMGENKEVEEAYLALTPSNPTLLDNEDVVIGADISQVCKNVGLSTEIDPEMKFSFRSFQNTVFGNKDIRQLRETEEDIALDELLYHGDYNANILMVCRERGSVFPYNAPFEEIQEATLQQQIKFLEGAREFGIGTPEDKCSGKLGVLGKVGHMVVRMSHVREFPESMTLRVTRSGLVFKRSTPRHAELEMKKTSAENSRDVHLNNIIGKRKLSAIRIGYPDSNSRCQSAVHEEGLDCSEILQSVDSNIITSIDSEVPPYSDERDSQLSSSEYHHHLSGCNVIDSVPLPRMNLQKRRKYKLVARDWRHHISAVELPNILTSEQMEKFNQLRPLLDTREMLKPVRNRLRKAAEHPLSPQQELWVKSTSNRRKKKEINQNKIRKLKPSTRASPIVLVG